jgi:hypothetical protein
MAFLTSIIMSGVILLTCLFFVEFSPGDFAASRALSVGSRGFPSMPFVYLPPLLAALNGMPQSPRGAVTAAWNALWRVWVWSPLHLAWAMMQFPYRPMTKECPFLSP